VFQSAVSAVDTPLQSDSSTNPYLQGSPTSHLTTHGTDAKYFLQWSTSGVEELQDRGSVSVKFHQVSLTRVIFSSDRLSSYRFPYFQRLTSCL